VVEVWKMLVFFNWEQEVAFRPFTSFYVCKTEIKNKGHTDEYHIIELREAHPDIRGRKVLIWIDDVASPECKNIMDNCEKYGVTCVRLNSTKEAEDFFTREQQLLGRSLDRLRIMTDMVRREDPKDKKKENYDAGLQLAQLLQKKFAYTQGILCYTGPKFLEINRKKFEDAGLSNVWATAARVDAITFAKFQGLPGNLAKYTPKTSTTDSSSSSSTS